MDLFQKQWTGKVRDAKDEYFVSAMGAEWFKETGWLFDSPEFAAITKKVREARGRAIVWPDSNDVFAAFAKCQPSSVKAVIIGQDPYHDGNADGLAFSCKLRPSPSWRVIEAELDKDIQFGKYLDCWGNLSSWAEQGVLLLNSCLTVENGKANSHASFGWDWFTGQIIQYLLKNHRHIVYNLWGGHAQKCFEAATAQLPEDVLWGAHNVTIQAAHPMVEQYKKERPEIQHEFYGLRVFSRTNRYLKEHGITPIEW